MLTKKRNTGGSDAPLWEIVPRQTMRMLMVTSALHLQRIGCSVIQKFILEVSEATISTMNHRDMAEVVHHILSRDSSTLELAVGSDSGNTAEIGTQASERTSRARTSR